MENNHFEWVNQLEMAIFNSKLSVITRGYPSCIPQSHFYKHHSSLSEGTSMVSPVDVHLDQSPKFTHE